MLKAIGLGLLTTVVFPWLSLLGWPLLYPALCAEAGPELCRQHTPRMAALLVGFFVLPWAAYAAYWYRHPLDKPLIASLREVRALSLRDRIILPSNLVGWAFAGISPLLLYRVLGLSTADWAYPLVWIACFLGGGLAGVALADWAEERAEPSIKVRSDPRLSPEMTVEGMRLAATWTGIASGVCFLIMWGIVWPRLTHFPLLPDILWISFLTPVPYALALITGVLARLIILQLLVSGTISRRAAIIGGVVGTILVWLATIVVIEFS